MRKATRLSFIEAGNAYAKYQAFFEKWVVALKHFVEQKAIPSLKIIEFGADDLRLGYLGRTFLLRHGCSFDGGEIISSIVSYRFDDLSQPPAYRKGVAIVVDKHGNAGLAGQHLGWNIRDAEDGETIMYTLLMGAVAAAE